MSGGCAVTIGTCLCPIWRSSFFRTRSDFHPWLPVPSFSDWRARSTAAYYDLCQFWVAVGAKKRLAVWRCFSSFFMRFGSNPSASDSLRYWTSHLPKRHTELDLIDRRSRSLIRSGLLTMNTVTNGRERCDTTKTTFWWNRNLPWNNTDWAKCYHYDQIFFVSVRKIVSEYEICRGCTFGRCELKIQKCRERLRIIMFDSFCRHRYFQNPLYLPQNI